MAKLWRTCEAKPKAGYIMHLILVDQADALNKKQQIDLRSKIDGPESLANVIWVFTATPTTKLDAGFRSRCMPLKFSTYGNAVAATELLQEEAPNAPPPNFARIIKEANGSIPSALMELELKLSLR